MAALEKLRKAVTDVLEELAAYFSQASGPGLQFEIECVFDTARDHYQIVDMGWRGEERLFNTVIHVDIKRDDKNSGKVWIQYNATEFSIAELLLERGLLKSDIVLGLQPPYKRPYTGYASE